MKNITSINTESFAAKKNIAYDAFIWLGKNFIQIAAASNDLSKVEAVKTFIKENGNITKSDAESVFKEKIIQNAKRNFIGLESKKYTYIPADLFNEDLKNDYLNSLYQIENTEAVDIQEIKAVKAYSAYTIKRGTQQLLNNTLNNLNVFHAPSALLIAYQQLLPPNKQYMSFVRLQQDEMLLTVFDNKKLLLHKTYNIDSIDDAVYYYFFVLQQLGIQSKKMYLNILGSHTGIEKFLDVCKPNVELAKFTNRLPTLQYNEAVFNYPTHDFFNLFALMLCV